MATRQRVAVLATVANQIEGIDMIKPRGQALPVTVSQFGPDVATAAPVLTFPELRAKSTGRDVKSSRARYGKPLTDRKPELRLVGESPLRSPVADRSDSARLGNVGPSTAL